MCLYTYTHAFFIIIIFLIVHTRLEEIARKLKSGDVLPLDRER